MTEDKNKKTEKNKDELHEFDEEDEEELEDSNKVTEDVGEDDELDLTDYKNNSIKTMPMIPLRGLSIFPYMVLHFDIGREKSISALEKAMMMNQLVFLSAQKDADTDLPTHEDFYKIGTIAKIKQMLKLPGDAIRVLVEGVSRGEIKDMILEVPYFKCTVKQIEEKEFEEIPSRLVALMRSTLGYFENYLELNPKISQDIFPSVASVDQPGRLADVITSHLDIKTEEKQKILEAYDPEDRLEILSEILSKENEILTIEQDINIKVRSQINKSQREYYLREQMRAIQEELGQDEAIEDEIATWMSQLKKLKLSPKITEKVEKEIKRLSRIQPSSAEGGVIRTYVEWILALPWNKASKGAIDIKNAEIILNEDHYGLEKVKDRILEYLAVMKLSKAMKGPILCLVGPPGVGKTSVAKSIARAVNREFVRMSLGGVRDEAEIRGHRRTYIGAIPGRVISAIKEAGTNNPVFLFDEVDKIGNDFRGDPASALLEVLDPEQNKEFLDHYLEIPFDLSKVMFITTANTTETIPRPLLDRMEVIYVPGYTEEEKVKIAEKYLIPKKIKEHGLSDENITISERTIRSIINYYTRESGVRNLERELANLCRKVARKIVEEDATRFRVTAGNIESYLGKKRFRYDIIEGENEIGVATGLAWTIVGGDTLFIETTLIPGSGKLVLTGQLGEVMQESAKAGVSYIRSISKELGINEDFYKENDLHIHIPEGATPKDGPSAGVTMCTAIISSLTNRPIRKDIAMTGEITLRGKVLPVGGIREKVLAAHRAGIKKVLLPAENEADIEEIPSNVRKRLEFVLIHNVSEALEHALVKTES
ncbi:MAG: endopeptidase La [Eubacteriales bacterium]|nr:endopeptidase La [Eubacteriales bacterium]MDD3199021.1 endopeptidase La [Eubacteriales bacterium]MDD4629493.1 endopeptidase La [Eubacteriales bacterium]